MKYLLAAAASVIAAAPSLALAHSETHLDAPTAIDCRQPPKDAVTALPAPLDRWASIECTPGAQFIIPSTGWVWRYPASFTTPVMVPAWTPNPAKAAVDAHYFVSARVEHASGEAAQALHRRLAGEVPNYGAMAETPVREAYTLRAENNHGEHFDIHFMYRSDQDVWGMVCAPKCGPEMAFVMNSRSN